MRGEKRQETRDRGIAEQQQLTQVGPSHVLGVGRHDSGELMGSAAIARLVMMRQSVATRQCGGIHGVALASNIPIGAPS